MYFFGLLVESFNFPLIDYMYDFMCKVFFWLKNCTFLGFDAILKKCNKLWSKTKPNDTRRVFKLEF